MSNMTPFEIRLELLKMAKDMLVEEYYGKKEQVTQDWQVKVENARHAGSAPPEHPPLPSYPTEADVVAKATQLNGFVSQIPHTTLEKTSKKST
jgi:hypothetical protein